MRLAISIGVLCLAACGGGGDETAKAKLASDLVTCKNERNGFREQAAESKAELEKTRKELESCTTHELPTVELHGGMGLPTHKEGNVPPDAVVKVLKQNVGGLRSCYEHALKRKPDLRFVQSVTARFQVKNTGVAINISFAPKADSEMEHCMSSTMEKWKFPTFQGDPVSFDLPINLVSK